MKYIVYIEHDNTINIVHTKTMREYNYLGNSYIKGTDWSLKEDVRLGVISFETYLRNRSHTFKFYTEIEMESIRHIKKLLPELFL